MQKINYGLIVSDFDGTLARSDGTLSPRTKSVIAEYVKNGGKFAVSTGRMPEAILPRVKELGLVGAVCCGQGSVIVDIETSEVLYQNAIPNAVAIAICKKMESLGLHIHVYGLWDFYSNMQDEDLAKYEAATACKAKLVLDRPLSQFLQESGLNPFKIIAMVAPEENEPLRRLLDNEHFEGCDVTRSHAWLVEIGNAGSSKGTSIRYLASRYGIPMEKTIAIGDQINDLSMVETAGLGLAVANADEQLKACATVCPDTNDQDAVANVIQKYGYTEE